MLGRKVLGFLAGYGFDSFLIFVADNRLEVASNGTRVLNLIWLFTRLDAQVNDGRFGLPITQHVKHVCLWLFSRRSRFSTRLESFDGSLEYGSVF